MGSRNSDILSQTRYFGRHLKRVVEMTLRGVSYATIAVVHVPLLFQKSVIPMVVKVEGYLEIYHSRVIPIKDEKEFELFLNADETNSPFFAALLSDYTEIRSYAESVTHSFQSFAYEDFRKLSEMVVFALRTNQKRSLEALCDDLEHLYSNADAYYELQDLP
jgi:hypothetical protein